ncbi:glycosyltransferase family 2 protein [Rhizobium glycinendophyticum]|uniref:Glycosyltransferase n=1 Tax=Rhizobium glycinendophyticum TaxID=2589807 RepID=A0A504U0M2_9HYPH|nr:glycosyltransferase [Rhizobium glycinendophyticum]TPP03925.1 glycosyltransferase [Rhizobium glycinendophyticum]
MRKTLILMPAYNPDSKELLDSVESLLQQTYPVDICIIDDGSRQPVKLPVQDPENKITLIRCEKNGGITAALRKGVEYALAKDYAYIGRLDVGDISYPKRLALQHAFLDANPKVGLVGTLSRVLDMGGREMFIHGVKPGVRNVRTQLWKSAPFKHSTFLMRSDVFRVVGNYDLDFNGSEDNELMQRIIKKFDIDCIQEVLIDYYDNPEGISSKKRNLQLRKRLSAMVKHPCPLSAGWYYGLMRTVGLIVMPHRVAKSISVGLWRQSNGNHAN